MWTHESIANAWSECLRQLNVTHHREPRDHYYNSNDRPDILAFDSVSGCDVELDISLLIHGMDVLSQAAQGDGIAASKREHSRAKIQSRV